MAVIYPATDVVQIVHQNNIHWDAEPLCVNRFILHPHARGPTNRQVPSPCHWTPSDTPNPLDQRCIHHCISHAATLNARAAVMHDNHHQHIPKLLGGRASLHWSRLVSDSNQPVSHMNDFAHQKILKRSSKDPLLMTLATITNETPWEASSSMSGAGAGSTYGECWTCALEPGRLGSLVPPRVVSCHCDRHYFSLGCFGP